MTRRRAINVEVREARAGDRPVLRRLMQLYLYDFAAIDGWNIGDDGRYGSASRIARFWTDRTRTSFLVRLDGRLAGFVLIRDGAHFAGRGTREISEFFVLRRYRRRRLGARAATRVFDMVPGTWGLCARPRNVDRQAPCRRRLSP